MEGGGRWEKAMGKGDWEEGRLLERGRQGRLERKEMAIGKGGNSYWYIYYIYNLQQSSCYLGGKTVKLFLMGLD